MFKRIETKEVPQINEWLFPKITVLLISGKAGVGKTTAAKLIQNYLSNELSMYAYCVSFAQGVKDVSKFLGWDGEKDKRGRVLLQNVGNAGREYDRNIWCMYSMTEFEIKVPPELVDVIVYDDWRFPNEAKFFLDQPEWYKVFTINVKAPPERELLRGTEEWKDVSETALDGYKYFNYIIENYGTLEVFEHDVVINVLLDIIEESKKGGKL